MIRVDTTDFSTPAWTRRGLDPVTPGPTVRPWRRVWTCLLAGWLLWCLMLAAPAMAREPEVLQSTVQRSADGVQVLTGFEALRCEREDTPAGARKFIVVARAGEEEVELRALERDLRSLRDRCDGRDDHCHIIEALHERADDIPLLANSLLERVDRKNQRKFSS